MTVLGDSFYVDVKASGKTFASEAASIVKKGTAALKAVIPLSADSKQLTADIKAAQLRLDALTKERREVKLGADTSTVDAKLAATKLELDALTSHKNKIDLGIETSGLSSGLQVVKRALQNSGVADIMDLNVPQGKIRGQLVLLKRLLSSSGLADVLDVNVDQSKLAGVLKKVTSQKATIDVAANTIGARTSLDALQVRVAELARQRAGVNVDLNDKQALVNLLELDTKLASLNRRTSNPRITVLGRERALVEIEKVSLALDKLSSKKATPSIAVKGAGSALAGASKVPTALALGAAALPAAGVLGGVGLGAAAGLGGSFVAGAGALAAFGAIAKPVLSDTLKAEQAVNTAQNNYNATIGAGIPKAQAQATLQAANAKAQQTYNAALASGANPAKALAAYHLALAHNQTAYNSATNAGTFNAKAYQKEQLAIAKAYADLSPQQIALSKQLGNMASAWQDLKAAQTPVVAGALQPWLKSVTDLTTKLGPIIAAVSPVIGKLGTQFDALINSKAFVTFRNFIANTGAKVTGAVGSTLIDFTKAMMILLPQFNPLINEMTGGIAKLGPAVLKWSQSKQASDDIKKFMQFFKDNGPVVKELITNVGLALKAFGGGVAGIGVIELKAVSDFLGLVARLPPGIATPIIALAGTGILLAKIPGILKLVSAQMWILDAAMDANPVGLIALLVEAIIALGVAFYIAWQKSAGFRDFIKGLGVLFITDVALPIIQGAKILTDGVLGAFGAIIDGAAKAFGWVPGLGPKLKDAAAKFDGFRDNVDGAFNTAIGTLNNWKDKLNNSMDQAGQKVRDASKQISGDFDSQGQAATRAKGDLGKYTDAITQNGITSEQGKKARKNLVDDMISAGVNAKTANGDVDKYTDAIHKNGVNSDEAKKARQQLITDILNASGNAKNGKRDMDNLTSAIQNHGAKSDAAKGARDRLIQDLKNSGVNANTAKGLVNDFTKSVTNIPAQKTVGINIVGKGTWTISQGASLQQALLSGSSFHGAAGGILDVTKGAVLSGYAPGFDNQTVAVSPGEGILVPEAVKAIGPGTVMALNRHYASGRKSTGMAFAGGGVTEYGGGFQAQGPWVTTQYDNTVAAGANAVSKAMTAAINAAVTAANSGGGSIVSDALSWLGKIPYVFGGNSLSSGLDCSGFTSAMYARHGIGGIPRTSEGQYAWAKSSGAVPGALAFYVSPGGGPPPGHVAIVENGSTVISQGGPGKGPTLMGLHGMPLMGIGVPPNGFPGGAGGGAVAAGPLQQMAQQMLNQRGWGNQWSAFNQLETREAGWNIHAVNPSSGAAGLAQFINGFGEYAQYGGDYSTGQGQLTAMMNYIAQRYGTPDAAWSHEVQAGWYDSGGYLPPGLSMAWNGTGQPEKITPPGQSNGNGYMSQADLAIIARLDKLIAVGLRNPAAVAQGLNGVAGRASSAAYYGG